MTGTENYCIYIHKYFISIASSYKENFMLRNNASVVMRHDAVSFPENSPSSGGAFSILQTMHLWF